MVNVNKLNAKMVELGTNVDELSEKIGMDRATFYRRLSADGQTFLIKEADAISKELGMTREEVNEIFEDGLKAEEDTNDDSNVDSDFDENDTLDIADMLFSKADLALDLDEAKKESKKEIKEKIKDDELVKVKKLNLNNISNFIYELPSKTKTAKNQDLLKIPNYISKMIPNFFELSDNSKTEEIDGAMYKVREVNIELVDVKNGKKYTDRNAKISYKVGQSYVSIISDVFKNVDYVEFDIARIIKLDSKVYHIEIITSDMQEYKLWSKLCNQDFKSSARKYGMM